MPAQLKNINLLPETEFEESLWGRFLKWAVTTGRYIIILTELVVIVVFLSRFKLDNDIRNLNARIEGQKQVLDARSQTEAEFRLVQKRLNSVDSMMKANIGVDKTFDLLVQKIPPEVKLTELKVTRTELTLTANTLDEKAMGIMLARMANDTTYKSLEVTSLDANQLTGIKFTVIAKL